MARLSTWGALLVLPGTLLLAACGGDDDDASSEPPAAAVEDAGPAMQAEAPAMQAEVPPAAAAEQPAAPAAQPEAPAAQAVAPAAQAEAPAAQPEAPAAQAADATPNPNLPLPSDVRATPNAEGNYVGIAEAVEADVIRMGATRLMLYGIDSVEPPQTCYIGNEPWQCWPAAVRQLQTFIGEGAVTCTPVDEPDPFGRILATCITINGDSLNEEMVRSGFALAVPEEMPEYVAAQDAAEAEGVGLWQGQFQDPVEFRAGRGIEIRRP